MEGMKTVVMDFDGVIHSYKSGFKGTTKIPDEPVAGIKEEIAKIRKKYKVVILSTRCSQKGGKEAMQRWLDLHGIVVDDIVDHKVPAHVYIDDRAVRFGGKAEGLLEEIELFTPWHDKVNVKK